MRKKKLNLVIPLKFQQCVGKFAETLFINWNRKKMKKKMGGKRNARNTERKLGIVYDLSVCVFHFLFIIRFFFSFRSV